MYRITKTKLNRGNSPAELEPWQTGYRLPSPTEVEDSLEQLSLTLSVTLATLKDIKTTQPPTVCDSIRSLCKLPAIDVISQLRQFVVLEDAVKRIQHLQSHILHNLRCQIYIDKSTTAPWAILPDEILARIFMLMCGQLQHRATSRGSGIFGRPGQIRAAAVCKRWRRIAHATPALWADISWDEHLPRAALDTWLSRAQSNPLRLSLTGLPCSTRRWELQTALLNRVSESGQLVHLSLEGHGPFLRYVADEWTAPAPNLKELEVRHIKGRCRHKPRAEGTFLRAPQTLPGLPSITFLRARPPLTLSSRAELLPGSVANSLEDLYLWCAAPAHDPSRLEQTLVILRTCPKLVYLTLDNIAFCANGPSTRRTCECRTAMLEKRHARVLLPNLESICLRGQGGCCWSWLSLLDVPRLRRTMGRSSVPADKWIRWNGREVPFPSPLPHHLESMGFALQ